jgi:hypothetical protein
MRGAAWVRQSLGFAVTATAFIAAASSTAFGQAPVAPTQEPPEAVISSLSLFDHGPADTKPAASWLSDVEVTCIGCRGFETTGLRLPPASANAPWVLEGRWRRQTALGIVSTGFVGARNYGLPLTTVIPLGGGLDPAALANAGASGFLPISQWTLTAGIEKTLVKRANGASVGVTGDVLIPLESDTKRLDEDPRIKALESATVRFGVAVRW